MLEHHKAWLEAHPERDAEWLYKKTGDGFDVHHIDGDHENNDPLNLLLMEHRDHFMLHSGGRPKFLRRKKRENKFGKPAYDARKIRTWNEVDDFLGIALGGAFQAAKRYAQEKDLIWPAPAPAKLPTEIRIAQRELRLMEVGEVAYHLKANGPKSYFWTKVLSEVEKRIPGDLPRVEVAAKFYAKATENKWPLNV